MTPSAYQQAIYDFVDKGNGNGNVEAVPGSGKTTTIVGAVNQIPMGRVFVGSFNKHIADELATRLPESVTSATLNKEGWGLIRKNGWVKLNEDKTANALKYKVLGDKDWKLFYKVKAAIVKTISLMKATESEDWLAVTDKYDIDVPDEPQFGDLLMQTWNICLGQTKVMDFDDQIFMAVHMDLVKPAYDWVFIDEDQDLSPMQLTFLSRLLRPGGRLIGVGDRNQSIYGFRGSDPDAVDKLVKTFDASCLPLSICYRCAATIVAEAANVYPGIESHSGAATGTVDEIDVPKMLALATDDDYVLCRTTAPLVKHCLGLIRQGRKATVKGRDIGQGLLDLANKVCSDDVDIVEFAAKLDDYEQEQTERLTKHRRDGELANLSDRADTLREIIIDCSRSGQIEAAVKKIFSDNATGVIFSTGHKSKGLETKRVFFLHPESIPHKMAKKDWAIVQEKNLRYVMITRAKESLYYVPERKP